MKTILKIILTTGVYNYVINKDNNNKIKLFSKNGFIWSMKVGGPFVDQTT